MPIVIARSNDGLVIARRLSPKQTACRLLRPCGLAMTTGKDENRLLRSARNDEQISREEKKIDTDSDTDADEIAT